jgi:hypothetical protein
MADEDDARFEVWLGRKGEGARPIRTFRSHRDAQATVDNWRAESKDNVGSVYRISRPEVEARREWRDGSESYRAEAIEAISGRVDVPAGLGENPYRYAHKDWDDLPQSVRRALGDRMRKGGSGV